MRIVVLPVLEVTHEPVMQPAKRYEVALITGKSRVYMDRDYVMDIIVATEERRLNATERTHWIFFPVYALCLCDLILCMRMSQSIL